jgi:hypothetical protein
MAISSTATLLWVLWRRVLQLPPLALGNRLHDSNAKGTARSGRVGRNPCPPKRGKVGAYGTISGVPGGANTTLANRDAVARVFRPNSSHVTAEFLFYRGAQGLCEYMNKTVNRRGRDRAGRYSTGRRFFPSIHEGDRSPEVGLRKRVNRNKGEANSCSGEGGSCLTQPL